MTYWVASDGLIVRVDPVFAQSSYDLQVVGQNLFGFISGMEVRHIYSLFHQRVLNDLCGIAFTYRCDSPTVRRDMSMKLTPDGGFIRYESVVMKEIARTVPLPCGVPDASALIGICSMCKKYRVDADPVEWKEIESILNEPDLPDQFDFTHTLCPECLEVCMGELNPMRKLELAEGIEPPTL